MRIQDAFTVLLFTTPAIGLALVGAALAAFKPPGPRTTSAVQHFAAGLAFAATSLELLPKERSQAALPVILGFALGLAAMLGIRQIAGAMEKRREGKQYQAGLVAVTAIDFVIDGLVLGVAFASGEQTGLLLSIALAFEVLFLSLSVGAALAGAGARRSRVLGIPVGLALLMSISAALGRVLFGSLAPFPFAILLGVGIVALLYLVTEELLVEAHEVPETPWAVGAFFLGFLLFLLLEMKVEG
jgi:ZIP family zinc transporter